MDQPGNHILLRGNQPGAADRMRELLARTVQDHVADQRSNAGALEDIRQRMEGLEWLVKEVREREVPGTTARLDSLARHLEEAAERPPQWAESLAEHIEVLRSAAGSTRWAASSASSSSRSPTSCGPGPGPSRSRRPWRRSSTPPRATWPPSSA